MFTTALWHCGSEIVPTQSRVREKASSTKDVEGSPRSCMPNLLLHVLGEQLAASAWALVAIQLWGYYGSEVEVRWDLSGHL